MADRLNDLAAASRRCADARGLGPFHTPKNLASALVVEAGEMADVLLYLVQMANVKGIDLVEAARRKMAVNEARFPAERGG